MKRIILFYLMFFQSVFYAQKSYDFNSVQGIIAYRIEKPYEVYPEQETEKTIQLLSQFEQSNSYKLASTADKLIVLATLAEISYEYGNITAGDNYIRQFIKLYEAGYTKSVDKQKNNSVNYFYRLFILFFAEDLSRNTTNFDDVLLCLEKAKKIKINFEDLDFSFDNQVFAYESMFYNNIGYYDIAINSINKAIELCKKPPFDKIHYEHIDYYYYLLNNYIISKINNEDLTTLKKKNLLNAIDKNIHKIENLNSNLTIWANVYSQKAITEYHRDNLAVALKYIEKSLRTSKSDSYFYYKYDYLVPKIYKLLIFAKKKDFNSVKTLKNEIENDKYFNEFSNNLDFKDNLILFYSALIEYEKFYKNYEGAMLYVERRYQILDSKKEKKFRVKMNEYDQKQKLLQKNIKITKLDNDKKQLIIFLIILNYLFLLFIAFGFFYIRKKRKESDLLFSKIKDVTENQINKINFAKQEALKELKKQFSMQLHTEVGSMLIATVNFLKVKKKIDQKLEDQQLWDSMIKELEKIYKTIRQESHDIYENSLSNQQFLVELEKNIQLIFNATNSFTLHTCIDINESTALNVDTKLSIITLIKEGCTNIIKHSKAKNIDINLVENDTSIILEIKDDGKQKLLNNNKKIGFGLNALKEMILKMNGNLHFGKRINCDGFEIIASFPK